MSAASDAAASGAPTTHLLAVWDPTVAEDAMGAHLEILRTFADRHRAGVVEDEDVYVWWGKIRSPNRLQPLPHLPEILAVDESLQNEAGPDREVHLYLTDYRSLYVAHVGEVTADDVREFEDEVVHVPAMYDRGVRCDCWFRLMDVRRLVLDDLDEVVRELRRLRNVRYHGKPVSLYGGMVELPLLVQRSDGQRFFEPRVRAQRTEGRLWVEYDAEHAGVRQMEATLRDDLLGAATWSELDPAARTFLTTAEKIFREHRADPAFDFSPVVVNIAKVYEAQLHALLGSLATRVPRETFLANVDGRTLHLLDEGPVALGQLARALAEERALNDALRTRCANGAWAAASLPPILVELARWRNAGAHRERVPRDQAMRLRNRHLGVGCQGIVVELAKVQ